MTLDRSKFKATSTQKVVEQEKAAGIVQSFSTRPYHTLDVGKNKLRIYPARNADDENSSYIFPKVCHFLPFLNEDKEEYYNKPVFNSRIHGNTEKDINEEYIKVASELFKKLSSEEYKKRSSIIKGYRDTQGAWHPGITAQAKWVCYADKYTSIGKSLKLIDLTPGCKDQMNKLSIMEAAGEPIQLDPFTDPDDGICLIIDYNNKAKKTSEYYICSLDEVAVSRFKRELVPTPLSDEDLEEWLKLDSLESLFVNSYKRSDFEKACIGLETFDIKYKMGVYESDEFQTILAEMDSLYEAEVGGEEEIDSKEEKINIAKEAKLPKKEVIEDIEEGEEEENLETLLSSMERDDLKLFIHEQKLGINIKPSYTEEQIRFLIQQTFEELNPKKEEKPSPQIEDSKFPTSTSSTAMDRIALLRKKQEEAKAKK